MIAIVDYKAGNLTSVKKAFDHIRAESVITADPEVVAKADKIVLPGVGHFAATCALSSAGLREAIASAIQREVPYLGICVGMQWMLESSEEAASVKGLGVWPGACEHFPADVKAPHVGWNQLEISNSPRGCLGEFRRGLCLFHTLLSRASDRSNCLQRPSMAGAFPRRWR